jgi:DNA-directed RNA polymerase specialized sigma24 family protein
VCSSAPENPQRIFHLAAKICREDYPELDQDEVPSFLFESLDYTLCHFDPGKGDQSVPVEDRFVGAFHSWLHQCLEKNRRRRLLPTGRPQSAPEDRGAVLKYDNWSRFLLNQVIGRLNERARVCLVRRLTGESFMAIASRLGVKTRTVTNHYSDKRLVTLLQNQVKDLILALPDHKLRAVIWHLLDDLPFPKVARLLCVDAGELRGRVGGGDGRVLPFHEVAAMISEKR